ncbi:YqhA family protein, partial [candidate division KSB1 bacterium]|nr:YqhA family protein [candidate division KSB1 bacterium]
YNKIILHIVTTVDDFLLGMVLLIFGLGSYDLFISKIEAAQEAARMENIRRPDWLKFNSLDELKSILGKVVLMILIINFLKFFVKLTFDEPVQIIYLASGIFLISLALKFSHGKDIEKTKI